jgi:catalase
MDIKTIEDDTNDRTAAHIAATLAYQVRRDHAPHRLPAQRDAHPKHHGTVEAELIVDPNIPEDLRYGVFATPGRRYQAWIRFSNAFRVRHDMERDARGIAIKLLGVNDDQATQDFLMVTHSAFFAATATDFLEFPAAVGSTGPKTAGALRAIRFFFRLHPPFRFRFRAFRAFGKTRIRAMSPLAIRYFSQTPYRLGPHEVKFSVRPAVPPSTGERFRFWLRTLPWRFRVLSFLKSSASSASEHFLRDELFRALTSGDVSFDFLVQRRADPDRMPLDNATVVWSERRSPYVKVATLRLPKQALTAAAITERLTFSEHLSFTPWHTVAHEPLGSINQARRIVYETISTLRHDMNGKRRREPLPGESPADYLRSL